MMNIVAKVLANKGEVYRVFSKGQNEVGPSKSLIFWTFSDVLDFFWPFNMGDFSFWYFWDIWLKKKLKNLILQKSKILGLAQIGSILLGWILGVANQSALEIGLLVVCENV